MMQSVGITGALPGTMITENDMNKEEAYEALRVRIVTNSVTPGEILNEKDLMAQLAIGRSPLREILLGIDFDFDFDRSRSFCEGGYRRLSSSSLIVFRKDDWYCSPMLVNE